ncbi:DUF4391 domain-containing protein [Gemmatimonadota bacterium DH-20]|uniref:DUF4391 domain-containing protein n=1 Tax=Gaopeijia maritima TaxID=3119007 RepID=A0ABU9EDB8_9BACT
MAGSLVMAGIAEWQRALGVPAEARVDRRVYKKLLLEGAKLTPADRKAIQEDVARIEWCASIKPQHGFRAGKLGLLDVPEVQLLHCELRDRSRVERVATIVHRRIPYPVLVLLSADESVALSAAEKRMSEAERGAVVVERVLVSRWTKEERPGMLERIAEAVAAGGRAASLDELYSRWMGALVDAEIDAKAGAEPRSELAPAEKLRLRDQIVTLERQIASASSRLKSERHFNRKVEIGAEIKRLKAELDDTWTQLTT